MEFDTNNVTVWLKLENIMLSERSQTQKVPYYMIPFNEILRICKSIEIKCRLEVARDWDRAWE